MELEKVFKMEEENLPTLPNRSDAKVGGRLKEFAERWNSAQRWQRAVVNKGVTWKWIQEPPLKTPRLTRGSQDLDLLEAEFISKGVVKETTGRPLFVSRIFSVPKSDGSRRLILDLKTLNSFLTAPKFKIANHNVLRKILPTGSFMAKIDIKDAYLHIPIAPRLCRFLSFVHNNKAYSFQALPFGLAVAPYVFTRVLKFPLQLLRKEGVQILAYLDDLIIWHQDPRKCQEHMRLTLTILQRLGFLINYEKSSLRPNQQVTWLGVV